MVICYLGLAYCGAGRCVFFTANGAVEKGYYLDSDFFITSNYRRSRKARWLDMALYNILSKIEAYCLNKIFGENLSAKDFDNRIKHAVYKTRHSEMIFPNLGANLSFVRVLKYIISSMSLSSLQKSKMVVVDHLHLSFDAFQTDIGDYGDAVSINQLSVNSRKILILSIKFLCFAIFSLCFKRKIEPHILSSLFVAYIFYERIKCYRSSQVHLYGYSYVLDMNFLAGFLRLDPSIVCFFHETQNYLDTSAHIECDVLYLPSELSCMYAKSNRNKFVADDYRYGVSNQQLAEVRDRVLSGFSENNNKKITVGIYGEGYYARDFSFVKAETIQEGRDVELKIIKFMADYIQNNDDMNFVIYPHYARGVESEEGAKKYYSSLLYNKNCRLNPVSKSSASEFDQVNVGIVIRSNIFWDRAYLGLYTLLISPFWRSDFIAETKLSSVALNIDDPDFGASFSYMVSRQSSFNFMADSML